MNTQDDRSLERNRGMCPAHNHIWDLQASKYPTEHILYTLCSGHNLISIIDIERGYTYKMDVRNHLTSSDETRFADNFAAPALGRTNERLTNCKPIVDFTDLFQGPQTKESFLTLRNSCERLTQNFSACQKLALVRDIAEKYTFRRARCLPR